MRARIREIRNMEVIENVIEKEKEEKELVKERRK